MPLTFKQQEALDTWHEFNQNTTAAAKHLNLARSTFRDRLYAAQDQEQISLNENESNTDNTKYKTSNLPGVRVSPDKNRKIANGNTFVLTAAQSNTKVHSEFWKALLNYCKENNAELHVSRYTYNKESFAGQNAKPDSDKSNNKDVWYDPKIIPYISDESLELTPDLIWCGELNIIPTRVNPISGFQSYTCLASCIIPHAKMAMESVPNMKHEKTKQVFTTGTVTLRNYIQKSAGQKAEFHHVFGAIIVEIDTDGTWWARQLNASSNGSFYDLNKLYTSKGVKPVKQIQAITHGDIHGLMLNKDVKKAVFSIGGILDKLRPKQQFFHDLIDFMPRNHHNINDPHFLHRMWKNNTSCVESEFDYVADWLTNPTTNDGAYRDWCDSFVVVSNHDQAIEHWLKNISALKDPENLVFWHKMNSAILTNKNPHAFEQALRMSIEKFGTNNQKHIKVIREDESYRILDEIEAGLHGHLGSNGSRGSPRNLSNAGKANTGHTHATGIFQGVYTTGLYADLDLKYNKGLSSWSHGCVITYLNAKRAILTFNKGRAWR